MPNPYANAKTWADSPSSHGTFKSLSFTKRGDEIQRAIDGRTEWLNGLVATSEKVIQEICRRREVDPSELLDLRNDVGSTINKYSEQSSPGLAAKSALEALQADLQAMQREAYGIRDAKNQCATLARVKKNIQPETSFALTFDALEALGF